jgi:hypothetical protein
MGLDPAKTKSVRGWSSAEWISAAAAAIAVLGFLGYTTIWNLLPTGAVATEMLGQWQAIDRPWHIVFRPDHSIGMSTIGPMRRGSYRLDSDDQLWVDMQDGGRFKAKVSIPAHDRMNLVNPDGESISFQRTGS